MQYENGVKFGTSAYLEEGKVGTTGNRYYDTDYGPYTLVPLGNDNFVIVYFADEEPLNGPPPGNNYQYGQVVHADANGWQRVGARFQMPPELQFHTRDDGQPAGPGRIVTLNKNHTRKGAASLLAVEPGSATVLSTVNLNLAFFWEAELSWISDTKFAIFERDEIVNPHAGFVTVLTVDGDTLTASPRTHLFDQAAGESYDPVSPVVIGDKLLIAGVYNGPQNPNYTDFEAPLRLPVLKVLDTNSLTIVDTYYPDVDADGITCEVRRGAVRGVALDDHSALVSMAIAACSGSPDSRNQGYVAVVHLDSDGKVASVDRQPRTNWPAYVEGQVMGPGYDAAPNPWRDPTRPDEIAGLATFNWYGENMSLVAPGVVAITWRTSYDSKDDNQQLVFYWSVSLATVLAWGIMKGEKFQRTVDDVQYLSSGNADEKPTQRVASDGTLLVSMYEAWSPDYNGSRYFTESIWMATVTLGQLSIVGQLDKTRVRPYLRH